MEYMNNPRAENFSQPETEISHALKHDDLHVGVDTYLFVSST